MLLKPRLKPSALGEIQSVPRKRARNMSIILIPPHSRQPTNDILAPKVPDVYTLLLRRIIFTCIYKDVATASAAHANLTVCNTARRDRFTCPRHNRLLCINRLKVSIVVTMPYWCAISKRYQLVYKGIVVSQKTQLHTRSRVHGPESRVECLSKRMRSTDCFQTTRK